MPFLGTDLFDRARAAAKRALGVVDEETQAAEAERRAQAEAQMRERIDLLNRFQAQREQAPARTDFEAYQQNPQLAIAERAAEQAGNIPVLGSVSRAAAASADPAVSPQKKVTETLNAAGDIGLTVGAPAIAGGLVNAARAGGIPGLLRAGGMLGAGVVGGEIANQGVQAGATALGASPDTAELAGTIADFTVEPLSIIGAVRSAAKRNVPGLDIPSVLRTTAGEPSPDVPPVTSTEAAKTLAGASADARKMRGVEATIERAPLDDAIKGEVRKNLDAAREFVPQRTVPQAEELFASTQVTPEQLSKIKPGDKLDNATLYRASGRVADLAGEVGRLEAQLADLTDEAAGPIRAQVDAARDEATRLLAAIDPTVSQNGRNLAFTKRLLKDFNPDELTEQALKVARSRRPGRLAGADEFEIRTAAAKAAGAKTAAEREAAYEGLSKAIGTQRLGPFESIAALRKAGLLTGFTTHVRNVGGNALFQGTEMLSQNASALIETGMAALGKDKTRLGAYTTPTVINETLKGAGEGLREAGDILLRGASAQDLARYDFANEVRTTLGPGLSQVADKAINLSFRALSAGDRPFRVAALKRSVATQAEAAAKNAGLSGKARTAFVQDFIANPPKEAGIQALADAEFAVFANRNEASTLFQKFRASKGDLGRAVIDQFIPFSKTPTNVLARVLDYSGVDALSKVGVLADVRNLDPAKRKAFADALGRGAVGWGMMSLGYWMAEKGSMSGPRGRGDSGERQVEEAADMPGGSVRVGNTWIDASTMAPTGMLLALGAAMYEADARQTGRAEAGTGAPLPKTPLAVGAGAVGVLDATLQQPMVQGVENMLRLGQQAAGAVRSDDPTGRAAEAAGDFAGRQAASFIPSIVAAVARARDPLRRDTYGPEEFRTEVGGVPVNTTFIRERIPGMREALPPQIDAQGNPVQASPVESLLPVRRSDADGYAEAAALSQIGFGPPGRREGETDAAYTQRVADTNQHVFYRAVAPLLSEEGSVTIGKRTFVVQPDDPGPVRRSIIDKAIEAARTEIRGRALNRETGVWEKEPKGSPLQGR